MTLIEERINSLKLSFSQFSNWEKKYQHIILLGQKLQPLDETEKIAENLVKGCQSQVWLIATLHIDKIIFKADSDAFITKGIMAVLLQIYSDLKSEEILSIPSQFLSEIGLQQHLSMSRSNGLNAMIKKMSFYAIAFQVQQNRS